MAPGEQSPGAVIFFPFRFGLTPGVSSVQVKCSRRWKDRGIIPQAGGVLAMARKVMKGGKPMNTVQEQGLVTGVRLDLSLTHYKKLE